MNILPKKIKSILTGTFMVFLITSGLFLMPSPVHAQGYPVIDVASIVKETIGNATNLESKIFAEKGFVKEYILDGLAWATAKGALRSITSNMVKAAASGHVNPDGTTIAEFVTNLKSYALHVGTRAAKKSITDIQKNVSTKATAYTKSLASSIGNHIQTEYYKNTAQTGFWSTHKETLSKVVKNPTDFLNGDFAAGGWDGWTALNSNANNNPYYIYQSAQSSVNKEVAVAKANKKTELSWGQGFLSNTHCKKSVCSIQTPGSVIKAQLNKTLGASVSSLVSADEIDEIIGSLAMGLVSKVVGSAGGLLGVAGSGSGGGSSAINQYLNEQSPTIGNLASSIKDQITKKEVEVNTYLSNLQIVFGPIGKAKLALQKLIDYIPTTNSTSNTCTATFNRDIIAANNVLSNVQSIYSSTSVSIVKAKEALSDLKKLKAQIQSANTATLQKIITSFQQLITSGVLPSASEIVNAQSAASISQGKLTSSGVAGLIVSGGTVSEQMNLIAQKAQDALNGIKTCFSVSSTGI